MNYDVIILGAGGAGMMCAIEAGRRHRRVLLLDHATRLGKKILISGGGRCNFTNTGAGPANYVSQNPHFCRSALSRFPSAQFVELVKKHHIPFHEKKLGQLFCDDSAQAIVDLLESECKQAGVEFSLGCEILEVSRLTENAGFEVRTRTATLRCQSLVVATGGLSVPKIGATGLGYEIARKFGLKIIATAPALDGFTFSDSETRSLKALAGVSIDCVMTCNGVSFRENLLFTHSGLSGPVALQASLHWYPKDKVHVNLLPDLDLFEWFLTKKKEGSRAQVRNLLSEVLPARFSDLFCELYFPIQLPLPQVSEKKLKEFCEKIQNWEITPSGTVGYNKAEVTRGGVDTQELSSKTMEARKVPGLYFVGEVMDVSGWLGGYNFQWAWASGWAAGQNC